MTVSLDHIPANVFDHRSSSFQALHSLVAFVLQQNFPPLPTVSDRSLPVFIIPIIFNLVSPSFTRSFSFPCPYHPGCCNLFWISLIFAFIQNLHNILKRFYEFHSTVPLYHALHLLVCCFSLDP